LCPSVHPATTCGLPSRIDPRGKFLLSVGMDSAGMTVYTIDQASGELKPIGHYPMGTQPNWIEIVDLK
jgi:6-phosphogluconolactonase